MISIRCWGYKLVLCTIKQYPVGEIETHDSNVIVVLWVHLSLMTDKELQWAALRYKQLVLLPSIGYFMKVNENYLHCINNTD